MASASGTASSYQRLLPVLSPPISSIAVRRGSNAYRTRVRPAFMLNPQLAHMRVARRLNPGTMGHSQRWASLLQEADTEVDTLQRRSDYPTICRIHRRTQLPMPRSQYVINGIMSSTAYCRRSPARRTSKLETPQL